MKNNFAIRIKEIRNALNLSQDDFAKPLGIKGKHISAIERAKSFPSESVKQLLIIKYRVNRSWLDSGEGEIFLKKTKTISEPDREFEKHGGWKPQTDAKGWDLIGKAHDILISETPYSVALAANINAFYYALVQDVENKKQAGEINNLKQECDELKDRLSALEKRIGVKGEVEDKRTAWGES